MSELVPAIPAAGVPVSVDQLVEIERQLGEALPTVTDFDTLAEWRAQGAALEGYLRSRKLQGPARGMQRRIEARVGVLLGEAKVGRPNPHSDEVSNDQDRADFRILARALSSPRTARRARRGGW